MNYHSAWSAQPQGVATGASKVARERWSARPRYTPQDFATLLWREKWLMLGVFLAIMALGLAAAMIQKKSYVASSSILVRLGQEYVYQPDLGDAARGAISTTDQIVTSEVQILQSPALHARVVDAVGVPRLFPDLAADYGAGNPAQRQQIRATAIESFGKNLLTATTPDTPVIRLSYKAAAPQVAAQALSRLLDEYLIYRRTILLDPSTSYLGDQRRVFENKLADVNKTYQDFLSSNGIQDFEAERSSLNALQASLTDENYRVQARLKEVEGRLGEMSRQVAAVPQEINVYRDTDPAAQQALTRLLIERQDLLARYKPTAQPVRDKDAQIAQAQAMIARTGGQGEGARRYGVNPVFQAAQTENIQLSAEAQSLRGRAAAIATQLGQVSSRRAQLTQLEPRNQELVQGRDVLQSNIRSLIEKEEQGQAASAIARKTNDNIRIVERPTAPSKGTSLKKPVAILAFLFAGFSALSLGLLRVFLRRGFPTASSAARTLDLPVLATARIKEPA